MEREKRIKRLIGVLVAIIALLICIIVYLLLVKEKNSNTTYNNSTTTITTTKATITTTTKNELDNNINQISIRTYRFFGYDVNKGPDMYTTLKLYSNNKYEFFINDCERVEKYSGNFIETDNLITLSGEANYTFNKKKDGNVLDFATANVDVCSESGGTFALESYYLK